MNTLKAIVRFIRNLVELYIPVLSFVIMFFVFIFQIFCRYVLRAPVQWAYEVTVMCYLWMVVLGACYAQRERSHVVFTLIYDKMPLRIKALFSCLGNGLIAFSMAYMFMPTLNMIQFQARQQTSVLKIGLDIVYAPFVVFMIAIFLYAAIEIWHNFRILIGVATQEEIQAVLDENKNEVDEAIEAAIVSEEGIE